VEFLAGEARNDEFLTGSARAGVEWSAFSGVPAGAASEVAFAAVGAAAGLA